ncbi:hypothetical protein JCGZ_24624 [Jatropha curcas]|uniref:Uncharacterized protein n=2 Tax=Jatropha curcas TaxID=180498 RepID=A0A067L801_JATCU|nr:hypothetical protein JCGZ_24624 [Jatropha curcas]
MAALIILLSVTLSGWLHRIQAEARLAPLGPPSSAPAMAATTQAFRMQDSKKNPFKKVDSSFRRIPPSTSNPTQNKCTPPLDGRRK